MRTRKAAGRRVLMMTSLVAAAGLALPTAQAFDSASANSYNSSSVVQTGACEGDTPLSGAHLESRRAVSGAEFASTSLHTDDRIIVVGIGTRAASIASNPPGTSDTTQFAIDGANGSQVRVSVRDEATGTYNVVIADRIIVVGVTPETCSGDSDRVVADRIIVVGGPTPGTTLDLAGRTVSINNNVASDNS